MTDQTVTIAGRAIGQGNGCNILALAESLEGRRLRPA
jgi:hypothetical protein